MLMVWQKNLSNWLKVTWQIAGREQILTQSLEGGVNFLREFHKDQLLYL